MIVNLSLRFPACTGLPNGFKGGEVTLPDGASIEDLLKTVGLAPPTPNLIVRDGRLADLQEILRDGEAIELTPPISGD
jgi:sulfur carrier protein ThiS